MIDRIKEIKDLSDEFKGCERALTALGDENRQHIILEMMQMERCGGVRVGELTERCGLSRPAVSHHIGILKAAGIIGLRREGTKNYYYFDPECEGINALLEMLEHARDVIASLSEQGCE